MIVAIDGPCGTGKSSVAKQVAKSNEFVYLDSGALYRLLAYQVHKKHLNIEDQSQIEKMFVDFEFDIRQEGDQEHYYLSQEDVTLAIRQPIISKEASKISQNPVVREKLLPIQRTFAQRHSVVMEGRDIATVVFPEAEVKIFLTASEEVRAHRRLLQLKEKFPHQSYSFQEVLKELQQRDFQDKTRTIAPLKPASDSVIIDSTDMMESEVVSRINQIIQSKKRGSNA